MQKSENQTMLLPRGETANVKIKLKEIHEQKQQHRVIQLSHLQNSFCVVQQKFNIENHKNWTRNVN